MKNYIQPGHNLTVPAPANIASGDGVVIGAIFGIAAIDALAGEDVTLATVGVYSMPKIAAEAFDVGDIVYFDEAADLVSTAALDNLAIGVAVRAAAENSAAVDVRLDGKFAA